MLNRLILAGILLLGAGLAPAHATGPSPGLSLPTYCPIPSSALSTQCASQLANGNGNAAYTDQTTTQSDPAKSEQSSLTQQTGNNNRAYAGQTGSDQSSETMQVGNGNGAFTYQSGTGQTATTSETGNGEWSATSSIGGGEPTTTTVTLTSF